MLQEYIDSENRENMRNQKRNKKRGNDRRRTMTTKDKRNQKRDKKPLFFVWYLAYNLCDLGGPSRIMQDPKSIIKVPSTL